MNAKKYTCVFFVMLFMFVSFGCALGDNSANEVDGAESKLAITLASNPTTGYIWQYRADDSEGMVEEISSVYEAGQSDFVGVGGKHVFTFIGVKPGTARLTFTYARPWEQVPPLKTIVFDVMVYDNKTLAIVSSTVEEK